MKDYVSQVKDSLFDIKPLYQAIVEIDESALTAAARNLLNREMRTGIGDGKLVAIVLVLQEGDRLCIQKDDVDAREPKFICPPGVKKDGA